MYMSYTKNPHLPHVRREAVRLFHSGWSARKIGRYLGYHHTAIMKWVRKNPHPKDQIIPTLSSRPHNHTRSLAPEIIQAIVKQRLKYNRCAEVVYQELFNQGIDVSLSSVKRTLDRRGLIRKRSPWKRYHQYIDRPNVEKPGDLVQIDSIHIFARQHQPLFYIYTLLDVFSRWAYARVSLKLNTHQSLSFAKLAQKYAPFKFNLIQSDHGQEFSTYFTENINLIHRHSRIRRPTDNAHLERFNKTLQEECLDRLNLSPLIYQKAINLYLPYYNNERLHLGLDLKTPSQWCQAID